MLTPPPLAQTVSDETAADLVDAIAKVKLLLPLPGDEMLPGEKVAVTPAGSPVIESATAEVNPFIGVVVIVMCPDAPCGILRLMALTVSVKLGVRTVRPTVWDRVVPPPAAVTVTIAAPTVALEFAANVKVLRPLPGAVRVAGEKLAVTPLASPATDNATGELKALAPLMVMVIGVEPERAILAVVALSESEKVGKTVRLSV